MSLEENKQIVRDYLAGVAVNRADLIHPDMSFFVAGNMQGCGWLDATTLRDLYDLLSRDAAAPLVVTPLHMIAEGNFVSVEAEGHMPLKNGRIYNNHYHLVFEIEEGKIRRVREYSDTDHLRQTFDLTGEPVGPPVAA